MKKDFLEKTLEDIIFDAQDRIVERNFPFVLQRTVRQWKLPSQKRIDLFSFTLSDNAIQCRIFELKREELGLASLVQIISYYNELVTLLFPHFTNVSIECFLVGRTIAPELMLLKDNLVNIDLYSYRYDFDGIKFNHYPSAWTYTHEEILKQVKETEKSKQFYKELLRYQYPFLEKEISEL